MKPLAPQTGPAAVRGIGGTAGRLSGPEGSSLSRGGDASACPEARPAMRDQLLRRMLQPPGPRPIDVVIDTDAFNEVDDQFALAYLLRHPRRLRLQAIYAAPFFNEKAASPREGMEKSYQEILKVLDLAGEAGYRRAVYKGADHFLSGPSAPAVSDASQDLVRRAMAHSPERPLYVLGIAAATDIASALLRCPEIRDRMVVVWLGGSAYHRMDQEEFNLIEDLPAAQVLFDSGVPLVQLPCWGVAEHLTVSRSELERYLLPAGPLCRYLASNVIREVQSYSSDLCWTKTIWDAAAAAWLLNDGGRFMEDELVPAPVPLRAGYAFPAGRHPMRYVRHIRRDALVSSLFQTLMGGGDL